MNVNTLISNLTGGELSPRLDGRVDIAKHKAGCKVLENFIVQVHGGVRKREGSRFIAPTKAPDDDVVFRPFQYSTEQSYMLMFGPGYVWFFKDRALITGDPVDITDATTAASTTITAAAHGFSNGDSVIIQGVVGMTELNNRIYTVSNVTTNTFRIGTDTRDYEAYVSDGTVAKVIELTTDYTADEIKVLDTAQSADVMYLVEKNHVLRTLNRNSHTDWTLEEPDITTGPFRTLNADRDNVISVSGFSTSATAYGTYEVGTTMTLTAVNDTFDAGMVGALFRLNEEGGQSGITGPPLGDTNKSPTAGDMYTYAGNVYGVGTTSGHTWGPYTRVPEHTSGTVKVIGDRSGAAFGSVYFTADFLHPTYCIVRITAYTSAKVVTAEIVRYQLPLSVVSTGTSYWEEGAWSTYRGFPSAVTFYEQRLMLAGSVSDPAVLWGSKPGVYLDFTDGADSDRAIIYRMASGAADVVRWLMPGRVLVAGTSAGEYAIAASSQNEALTPSNVKAVLQTTYGTSSVKPVRLNQVILYPQRDGRPSNAARKLREFSYDFARDGFTSVDLTVFSEHVLVDGVSSLAFQLAPDATVWIARGDGELVGCTYERTQEVVAWHRHPITNGIVTAVGTLPGASGDELWLCVERTIDGAAARTIEVIAFDNRDNTAKADAIYVDAAAIYDGTATTSLSGLWHLRGEEVVILADGNAATGTVDATGHLTLATAASYVIVGKTIVSSLVTEDLEAGAQAGTAQSRPKRIHQLFLRTLNSLGGEAGPYLGTLRPILYRTVSDPTDTSPPLASGFHDHGFDGTWERKAEIEVYHDEPYPMHITGLVAEINTVG